jgi:RimJ/RimL family protein N-acetyltransferase
MLKGEKVLLRAVTPEDLPRYLEFKNDVEIHFLSSDGPPVSLTLEALQAEYKASLEPKGDLVWFAIETNGKFVGQCILHNFDHLSATCEVGITIGDREYWGRGYGREALRMLMDHAFRHLNIRKIWLRTTGNNERAIRSYKACGFVEEGRQREQAWCGEGYEDVVIMGAFGEVSSS